jgi:hypothetical protein
MTTSEFVEGKEEEGGDSANEEAVWKGPVEGFREQAFGALSFSIH